MYRNLLPKHLMYIKPKTWVRKLRFYRMQNFEEVKQGEEYLKICSIQHSARSPTFFFSRKISLAAKMYNVYDEYIRKISNNCNKKYLFFLFAAKFTTNNDSFPFSFYNITHSDWRARDMVVTFGEFVNLWRLLWLDIATLCWLRIRYCEKVPGQDPGQEGL